MTEKTVSSSYDHKRLRQIKFIDNQCGIFLFDNLAKPKFKVEAKLNETITKPGPILKSKGMRAIFQKKGKTMFKNGQKRAKYLKIWAKIF